MTDDRELSSEEMIRQARGGRTDSSDALIRDAKESVSETPDIAGLDDIGVEIPVADRFPEPIPEFQTSRPRRVRRQPTRIPQGPVSTDRASRVIVFAVALMVALIAIGAFVALSASTP